MALWYNEPMSTLTPVIATSNYHLCALVREAIAQYGHECDLNHIDVSGLEDFTAVFNSTMFQGDISRWDTSGARTMDKMFQHSSFNGDISKWNVSRVASMEDMFASSFFNNDVSDWDTSSLVHANRLFENSAFNGNISRWDVSHVTRMMGIFAYSDFNGDLSNWDTGSLVQANRMFAFSVFTGDISRWNMANVVSAAQMFQGCPFNGDIANWNLSSLTDASAMFAFSAFDGDLSRWDLTQAGRQCNMAEMFQSNQSFTGDLSHWTLKNGSHTTGMFSKDFKGILPQAVDAWDNDYVFYQRLFDHDEAFDAYLTGMPFNHAHAHVLSASAIWPHWLSKNDYTWFKEVSGMARSVGMDQHAMAMLVLGQYRERHGQQATPENWSVTNLLEDTPS